MGGLIESWFFNTPDFPWRTSGWRNWLMACSVVACGSLAAALVLPRRWEAACATIALGLVGCVASATLMRAYARHAAIPLVSRQSAAFNAYAQSMSACWFTLRYVLPLNLAGWILLEQAFYRHPFWDYAMEEYSRLSSGMLAFILSALCGRFFMRHALKGRDAWGLDTTKGRITPAPRVE